MDTVWKAIIWHQLGVTIQMFENNAVKHRYNGHLNFSGLDYILTSAM